MKSTSLSYLFFLLTSTAALHAQSLIEQDCTIQIQSTGVKLLNWTGHVGRTYFIQSSPDLANWSWAPNIEAGENRPMSYEVDGPAKAGFFRLQYTDLTAPNLDSADFDGDGLNNLDEITQRPRPTGASLNQSLQTSSAMPVPMSTRQTSSISTRATPSQYIQTNPLKADTDDDGLTDKWEEDHQLDPTDNGSNNINNGPNGDPDGDGLNNAQEQSLGTDPFGNASTSDSDGDGILDIEDAMPGYGLVSWKRAAECNYVLIEVDSPSTYGYAEDLNDNGEVLFPDGIWSGGNWIAQSPVPVIEVTDNGDPYEIRFGNWTNFNSNQQIMGTASFLVTDGQGAGFGSRIPAIWPSTLSSPIPLPDCMAIFWAIRHWPIGVTESGQMVSRIGKSYPQFSVETINRYSPSGTLISELGGSNGFHPTGGGGHGSVSSSGWIASNLARDSSSSQSAAYKVGLWDPSDHPVVLPAEANGWGYPIRTKDLPDGKFVLTAGVDNGTDTTGRVFLKNPAGQFEYATQLADKKLELFAGDGTALTSDNKLWRNGELTPMADLCPRYKELLVDHHIFPIRSNKNGTYLIRIESTNEGEETWKNALLLPVEIVLDENQSGKTGDLIPSNKGSTGEKHYVSPKKTTEIPDDFVVLKAVGVEQDRFVELLEWEGGEAHPTDPIKRRVKRDAAAKTVVKIKAKQGGAEAAKMNVWVVWSEVNATVAEDYQFLPSGDPWDRWSYGSSPLYAKIWKFRFTIQPATIITAADRPKLEGANYTKPPGHGTPHHHLIQYPADHASHKWDTSRQLEVTVVNPNLIPKANFPELPEYANQPKAQDVPVPFPNDPVQGNDDPGGVGFLDEDANPYVAFQDQIRVDLSHQIGQISCNDRPEFTFLNSMGIQGSILSIVANYKEFARLNLVAAGNNAADGEGWYRISDHMLWHHVMAATYGEHPTGSGTFRWVDSGSISATGRFEIPEEP